MGICHASSVGCLLAWSGPDHWRDKYPLRVYSVKILLMMDSRPVRNIQNSLSNKFEKLCISLDFIVRIGSSSSPYCVPD